MDSSDHLNYIRIEKAIGYIHEHFKKQPSLEEVAEKVHLSSFHFQRLFKEWAGVSPKKFLQYISTNYAKRLLKEEQATLSNTSFEIGLSGTSRLHDLFIKIEGMTPAEYKNGGKNLTINYSFAESPFGEIIVASTTKGVCFMAFSSDRDVSFHQLLQTFPQASFQQKVDLIQQNALFIFRHDWNNLLEIKLHLKGTIFQLKVWEALIRIPPGKISSYGQIAKNIHHSKASRAVGTAIGVNPVAYLIPCHRVIRSTGEIGNYHWGKNKKVAMLGWESVRYN